MATTGTRWLGGACLAWTWLAGCGPVPEAPAPPSASCTIARADAGGPFTSEVNDALDPLDVARIRIREARHTSDPGFYTLAQQALDCALEADPDREEARRWQGHVLLQFHRFADAEHQLRPLAEQTDHWRDWMLLSDARMEQGDLEEASALIDRALSQHPSLETYDRAAHVAWLQGHFEDALALQEQAVSSGTATDPEPLAWSLVRLGELKALQGHTPNELGLALQLTPSYKPAHLSLGRWMLHNSSTMNAEKHLLQAGDTVAARRALRELDPAVDVASVGSQDARGYAIWVAPTKPDLALRLLEGELAQRRDAATLMAWAWSLHHAGENGKTKALDALSTGTIDPEVLWMGAVVLDDPSIARRALDAAPGLLPSQADDVRSILSRHGSPAK